MGTLHRVNAGSRIAVIKIVGFSRDLTHTVFVVVRTVEIPQTLCTFLPVSLNHVTVIQFISNSNAFNGRIKGAIYAGIC